MPSNSKKKKRHDRAEGTDDREDTREETAHKIEEQKIKKAKLKSLFTRRKNQLADLLEDGVASNCEIRASRKKLDEAQENVIEDLTSLAALYSEATDRSGVEKTRRELEEIEEEFFKAQESVQEYLVSNNQSISQSINQSISIIQPIRVNYRVKRRDFLGNYVICIHKKQTHNRALHDNQFVNGEKASESLVREPERSLPSDMGARHHDAYSYGTEGEQFTHPEHPLTTTMVTTKATEPAKYLALRAVPVVVKNGK